MTSYAVTRGGRIVPLDDEGNREFSPRTMQVIRYLSVAFLSAVATVVLLLVTGLLPPAPWSPAGQVVPPDPAPTVVPGPSCSDGVPV